MAVDVNRLAQIFIWKEGSTPDIHYARQILSVVNPDAAQAIEVDDPPIKLFSVAPPWPDDLWARATADLQGLSAFGEVEEKGADWTDTTRYDLAGWQGSDRRTGEHIFVVTAYRRTTSPLLESDFVGGGVGAPSQGVSNAPRPPLAQVPYYPLRPTGPLAWPPVGEEPSNTQAQAGPYSYPYSPIQTGPLGVALGNMAESAAAHAALLDSYNSFYTGFGPRVTAGLVDFFCMSLFQLVTLLALFARGNREQPSDFGGWIATYTPYACLALAIFAAYHVVQWSLWGQTVGKRLVGLKVVAPDGGVPGWGRSLLRMVGYFFSMSLGGWGVVMIALDLRHQGLHDKIAETFVVPEKASVPAPAGLPGYRAPSQMQANTADQHAQPQRRGANRTAGMEGVSPALGMANVAAAHPYNRVQIETDLGPEPVGRSRRDSEDVSRTTVPVAETSPTPPVEFGKAHAMDGTTVPNLDLISTGPFTEPPVSQEAIENVSLPDAKQMPPGTTQARVFFKAGLAQMEAGVGPGLRGYKVEPGPAREAANLFKQALERVPGSVVYRYFYAIALRYSEGFEVTIGELRQVLEQDPTHYEARQQVAYGPRWHDAFAYPGWVSPAPVANGALLPDAIRALLPPGRQSATRLVLLREGGLKVAAFLSRTPRAAWNKEPSPEMPARLELFLSRTPFGPIIALYIVVKDDAENPYIGETFLNPHDPGSPSEDACQLGQNMLEQIARRQDRTYLIFADENDRLLLSRKLVFDSTTQVSTARILYEVQTLPPQVMDQERFRQAAQWHMDHFSLDQLKG